jgi:hypothetical protein
VTEGTWLSLKPDLNPYRYFSPIPTHPLAAPPRTSLYAQALHVGEGKGEAPTLQETLPRNLSPLPDSLPLSGRSPIPVGVEVPAPVWVLTG